MAEELHLDHSTISVRLKHYKKRFPELFDEAGREKFMELRKKERAAKREERQKNLKQPMRSSSMAHLVDKVYW